MSAPAMTDNQSVVRLKTRKQSFLPAHIRQSVRAVLVSPSLQRLQTTFLVFEAEMNALMAQDGRGWLEQANKLLQGAKDAAERGDSESGWRYLKAADRFTWFGLAKVAPDQLQSKVESLCQEAADEKKGVTQWRRESIDKLLKDEKGAILKVSDQQVHRMVEAKRLFDEHTDNVYQRLAILRTRLTYLCFLGLVFLGLWFVILPPLPRFVTADGGTGSWAALAGSPARFWAVTVLAGILGALISAFTSAIGVNPKLSNIPAELSTQTITAARLTVAALSALAVTWFLTSGILDLGRQDYPFLIAVAIVAGFSDRLLLSAIEGAAKPA